MFYCKVKQLLHEVCVHSKKNNFNENKTKCLKYHSVYNIVFYNFHINSFEVFV